MHFQGVGGAPRPVGNSSQTREVPGQGRNQPLREAAEDLQRVGIAVVNKPAAVTTPAPLASRTVVPVVKPAAVVVVSGNNPHAQMNAVQRHVPLAAQSAMAQRSEPVPLSQQSRNAVPLSQQGRNDSGTERREVSGKRI